MDNESKSMTLDEFESTFAPRLDAIAEVINSHPEAIPESEDSYDLSMTITAVRDELTRALSNRVEEIAVRDKQIETLEKKFNQERDLAHKFYLQISSKDSQIRDMQASAMNPNTHQDTQKELSWEEVRNIIASV